MSRKSLYLALVLLLFVNAFVLAGVAGNRAGTPEASMILTERELPVNLGTFFEGEEGGVALRLNWNPFQGEQAWFDRAKLEELGFNTRSPEKWQGEDWVRYRSPLPKKAFAVLEYQGETWTRFKEEEERALAVIAEKVKNGDAPPEHLQNRRQLYQNALVSASRLFVVDAGLDPKALRQRYPDRARFIISPAKVAMRVDWGPAAEGKGKVRKITGYVTQVLVDTLHLRRDLQEPLLKLGEKGRISPGVTYYGPGEAPRPRYEVEVNWGARYEPWVKAVRLTGGEN